MRNQKDRNEELDYIEAYIVRLNIDSPIDRWWRKKHNVAFNSAEHRAISIVDQYAEWYEDYIYKEIRDNAKKKEENPYVRNGGDFLYSRDDIIQEMSEEEFDDIDLSDPRWQILK